MQTWRCGNVDATCSRDRFCRFSSATVSLVQHFGKITTLVNNAAKQGKAVKDFSELEYERVAETFTINILSFFETSKAAVKHMVRRTHMLASRAVVRLAVSS